MFEISGAALDIEVLTDSCGPARSMSSPATSCAGCHRRPGQKSEEPAAAKASSPKDSPARMARSREDQDRQSCQEWRLPPHRGIEHSTWKAKGRFKSIEIQGQLEHNVLRTHDILLACSQHVKMFNTNNKPKTNAFCTSYRAYLLSCSRGLTFVLLCYIHVISTV